MIRAGHGPLENILTHYTLTHVNYFLREIDRRDRRSFTESITAMRISQTSDKDYKQIMGRLRQQERSIALHNAKQDGYRPKFERTKEEIEKLSAQDHTWFSDFSPEEQEKFETERKALWEQIPPHLREKAEKMAGR